VRRAIPELAHLGFDPIEDMMSWERFAVMLRSRHVGIKTLLMDQQFAAGIGNLYSDEILFAAGLRYDRASDSLSATEIRRLYRAMVETLADAIKHRGSSLADEQYRDSSARSATIRAATRSTTGRASRAGAAATRSCG